MNIDKIVLSGALAVFLLSGCATKHLNEDYNKYSKKGYQNLKDGNKNSIAQKIKQDEIKIDKKYIDLSIAKDLSDVLKEIGLKNNRLYSLCSQDIVLRKSASSKLLNITDFNSLKKYIEDTTNYTMIITDNKYIKNRVKKVLLIDKEAKKAGFDDITFHINGKESVSAALSTLAKKINYSVIYDEDLNSVQNSDTENSDAENSFKQKDISYNGRNINNFLSYIENNFDVYTHIDYRNKIISIKKYKTNIFAIYPLNYKITQDSSTGGVASSSSSDSSSSSSSDSSSGGEQSTKQSYSSNVVETIKTDLENILVKNSAAKLIFNIDSGEVIVKTTHNNMKEIKEFIEKINNVYSQQLEITVDIYEFVLDRDFNFGTDIFAKNSNVNFATNNLVSSILRGTYTKNGNSRGFSADANNKFIRYSKSYSYKQTMMNNIAKTMSIQNNRDYVKSVSSTTTTNTATTTASDVEISSVNQGVLIDILPRIIGDRISLKSDIAISNLNELKTTTDSNGNTISLPDTDTKTIPSHLIIGNGDRVLVGSYQDYQDVKSYTGIAPIEDFIIGGNSGKKFVKKEILVVLSAKIIK